MAKFKIATPAGASFTVAGGGYDYEMEPLEGIEESLRYSVRSWVGWYAPTYNTWAAPLGIFGYAVPHIIGEGCMPWMITTRYVERHHPPRWFGLGAH